MNKIHKPPQLAEAVHDRLYQLTKEIDISYIFYHQATTNSKAQILIVPSDGKVVEMLENRKCIRNSLQHFEIIIHVINQSRMEFLYRRGNPFIAYSCDKYALIYQNTQINQLTQTDWKSFKKKYWKYREEFHHDHDIFEAEISRYKSFSGFTSMFLSYEALFTHNVEFLESLYFGISYYSDNLHQRIKRIGKIFPPIEALFVKENESQYFLILQIEKGKMAAENEDAIYINEDFLSEIKDIEQKLYDMICNRFIELKQLIKLGVKQNPPILDFITEETILTKIVSHITNIKQVEEIFLFHKKEGTDESMYYLLLVGQGLGTRILNQIQQSVGSNFKNCSVVLIGHSRIWIQKDLYVHQTFFQKLMTKENKIYESHQFHPPVHWENPYTPYYPDLDYAFSSAKRLVAHYFTLRYHKEEKNAEGLLDMFSNSLMRIFRTFIYAKFSYRIHYLSSENLWKMCLCAEPSLEKVEYLFNKLFEQNFFIVVDKHTRFHHDLLRITDEKLIVMDEILTVLFDKLKETVKGVNEEFINWN